MRPIAAYAEGVVVSTRVGQVTPANTRHSLRNGFTAYIVLSPAIGLSCHRHRREFLPAGLTPASRRQDHTILPSASGAVRQRRISVHRIPTCIRDDRETPLGVGRDREGYTGDLRLRKKLNIFAKGAGQAMQ
jgi:hypothetical protein